jgi:signal transduction histidine kinase
MTNLFIIALPVVIALNLLLGVIVLFTHVRRLANRVFALLSLVLALWLACQLIGSTVADEVWLAFWIRQSCAVSVFVPLLFYLLRGAVAQPEETATRLLRGSWLWFVAAVAAAVLSQTHFFLVGARLSTEAGALAEPLYAPGFTLFVGYWSVTVMALVLSFLRSLKQAEGVCRMELQIMALGSFFALVPGVLLILVIPLLTGSSQSARFTPIAVAIWQGVIAYGIATRHIMGVGEFLRRAVTYALLAGFLTVLYVLAFRLVQSLPLDGGDVQHTAAHGVAAIVVALTLAPASVFLRHGSDRLFDGGHDEVSRLLNRGSILARSITTVDALFQDFGCLLQESLGLSHVCVYLRSGARFVLHTRLGEADVSEAVGEDDPVPRALQLEHYPLLRDVLRRAGCTPLQAQAERVLFRLGAEAAIALHSSNGLVGFLLLGRRQNGRVFGRREEDALMLLGDQMGIALENATLYTRLQDARIYNEVLLDNLVTGVVAADTTGRVTVCNREAQRILHFDGADAAVGRPAAEILPAPIWDELRASLVSGRDMRDRDLVLRHPSSAGEQTVRFATAVFGGDESVAAGVLLVLQDTSAIRKLEEQVRRSDRLASIGTLAAGMAHEIKNPLVCLKTFVQLLPTQYDNPDFRDTFTPLLGTEVERINAIVSQLLNLSRPVQPTLVPLSLHAALDAAWQLAAQQSKAKGLTFDRQYFAANDRLLGDHRLLGQVFLNLFLNGIDATDRGGTLTVSTRAVGRPEQSWGQGLQQAQKWVEVRVRDTGRGIAPEDQQRIFDPFFTTKAHGTGLGLSVAHGIVLEHKGSLEVESALGVGTCFRILLPLLVDSSGDDDHAEKGAE